MKTILVSMEVRSVHTSILQEVNDMACRVNEELSWTEMIFCTLSLMFCSASVDTMDLSSCYTYCYIIKNITSAKTTV